VEGASAVKPSDFEYFIFDLDGTLFSLPVDWAAVRDEFAALAGEKIEGKPLFQEVQRVVLARPALKHDILSVIESHELRALDSVKPMPGAVELIYSLFEVSKLALVTLQGRRACDEILRKHKMLDLFETVVTREDSLDRATQLEAALNRLGVRPRDAFFVGDRMNDVVCARKVGVTVALVGKGVRDDLKPDFKFEELAELKAFFP
jgi:phosphoglycolate phosphatase-like HAD superfamily hydrolase